MLNVCKKLHEPHNVKACIQSDVKPLPPPHLPLHTHTQCMLCICCRSVKMFSPSILPTYISIHSLLHTRKTWQKESYKRSSSLLFLDWMQWHFKNLSLTVEIAPHHQAVIMVTQHIPSMTKNHHGGNLSVMNMVGICRWQNPTFDNEDDEVG